MTWYSRKQLANSAAHFMRCRGYATAVLSVSTDSSPSRSAEINAEHMRALPLRTFIYTKGERNVWTLFSCFVGAGFATWR